MTAPIHQRLVEGIDTRLIGREAELQQLHAAYDRAMQHSRTRLLAIVGDIGVGKSRLWYEFEGQLAAQPQFPVYFKGRATPEMTNIPYSIWRDLFRARFEILETDSITAVREKFETHMGPHLDEMGHAHLVGHLLGFDFSATTAVRNLSTSTSLAVIAAGYLVKYFRNLTQQPTLLFLEDLQWADNASLDLLVRLLADLPRQKFLLVALARPLLYQRRPELEKDSRVTRIDLTPLNLDDSRALIDHILQKVEDLPERLREMILASAEGNPFYLEELIRLLIKDGVIERGVGATWRVKTEQLRRFTVPPSLQALLISRLNDLPSEEREMLQRASVIGRIFWDAALDALTDGVASRSVRNLLTQLRMRELIFPRDRSAFKDAQEYIFKSSVLREAAYESLPSDLKRRYHKQLAQWLEANGRTRRDEYLPLVAEHYEKAGEVVLAIAALRDAGDRASGISAFTEARSFYQRALTFLEKQTGREGEIAVVHLKISDTYWRVGSFDAAQAHADTALLLARQLNAQTITADALTQLGQIIAESGDYARAEELFTEALPLARAAGDKVTLARVLYALGNVNWQRGNLDRAQLNCAESLALATQLRDLTIQLLALNRLGSLAGLRGDAAEQERIYKDALDLAVEVGNRERAMGLLNNLGTLADRQGKYELALEYYQQSLAIVREIGAVQAHAQFVANLAQTEIKLGQLAAARAHLREAVEIGQRIGAVSRLTGSVVFYARLLGAENNRAKGLEVLAVAKKHPAHSRDTQRVLEAVLKDWGLDEQALPTETKLTYEQIMQEILQGSS